jgi:hypothetical protein
LEDTGRGLAANPVTASQVKEKAPDCKEYTIMLIGSIGKIHSFKISRKSLIYILGFFSLYMMISVIVIYLYFGLYGEHRKQSVAIKGLESALDEKEKAMDHNKLYIEGLEDYIKNHPGESENRENSDKAQDTDIKQAVNSPDKEKVTAGDKAGPEKTAPANPVDVKDVKFRIDKPGLLVEYKLENNLADKGPAEGYIHIIVQDKNGEFPPEWNKASNSLKNGMPLNYKNGQEFSIQRFKTYQRQYKMLSDFELPSLIRILVYDRTGQKILEKEIPVVDVPSNDQS